MSGLVLELQRDSLNRSVRVSDLLRKALVVSRKLNISEIQEWINFELKGYSREDDVPDYRDIYGIPKVWNPYHGLQPINFGDPKMANLLSHRKNSQAVGELDELISKGGADFLQMPYPQNIINMLMDAMNLPLQPLLLIPKTEIIGILDTVRNKILEWSLELELKGIIGEGMSFTEKEKKTANSVNYQITNNIGSMSNSQLQQDSPNATQTLSINADLLPIQQFIETLKNRFDELQLDTSEKQELKAEINTIEHQLTSPKPKQIIVNEALKSIRSLLEGITCNIIASGLLHQFASIFI